MNTKKFSIVAFLAAFTMVSATSAFAMTKADSVRQNGGASSFSAPSLDGYGSPVADLPIIVDSKTGMTMSVTPTAYKKAQSTLKSLSAPKEGRATLTVANPVTGKMVEVDANGMETITAVQKILDGGDQPSGGGTPTGPVGTSSDLLSIAVTPDEVSSGASTVVSWVTQNVTKCSVIIGGKTHNGTMNEGVKDGPITTDTTYTLTCTDAAGNQVSKSATVSVLVDVDAPDVTAAAIPDTIDYNTSTKITWTTLNAKSCTVYDGTKKLNSTPIDATNTNGVNTGNLKATKTYVVECVGPTGKKGSDTVVVTVNPPKQPVVTFTADPSTVDYNTTTKLSWSATDADKCKVTGAGFNKTTLTGDGVETPKLTKTTKFTATCTGPGGAATEDVEVLVNPPEVPTADLTASANEVYAGSQVVLHYTSKNATSCAVYQNGSKLFGIQMDKDYPVTLNTSAAFGLTCSGPGGSVAKVVAVQAKLVQQTNANDNTDVPVGGGGGIGHSPIQRSLSDY